MGLVTNYGEGGGCKTGGGGHVKFYPYEKGGRKSFSHAEGGHKQFWGSFYAVPWSLSHIEGGRKKFPLFKTGGGGGGGGGGAQNVFPCLEGGGGAKCFRPAVFPFCSPPSCN